MSDELSTRAENSNLTAADLYAPDGGDGPDSEYPFLTEYQRERIQDFITEAEFAYEESPVETSTPDNQGEVEAAEKKIFDYIGLLLAQRAAEVERLRAQITQGVLLTREDTIRLLGDMMSDLSEQCYCAGWLTMTEEIVPQLCAQALATNENQAWGAGELYVYQAREMTRLATALGHWATLNMNPGAEYIAYTPKGRDS